MNTPSIESLPQAPRFRGELLNRIYRIWLFRRLMPVLAVEIAFFAILLWALSRSVFVRRVLENALNVVFTDPTSIASFFISAFLHAAPLTQVMSIAIAIAGAFFIRHLTQGILRWILVRQNYFGKIEAKKGE